MSKKKRMKKRVSYRFPVRVTEALASRSARTGVPQTTITVRALEKELGL